MKSVYKFILLIAAILTFDGCSKYVDGPKISLRTKKARLCGTWKIDKVTLDGNDVTATYLTGAGDYRMEIKKDGSYSTVGIVPDKGTWKLGEDKDDVFMTSDTPSAFSSQTFRILRLKNKDMWWRFTEPNGSYVIYYFVPG